MHILPSPSLYNLSSTRISFVEPTLFFTLFSIEDCINLLNNKGVTPSIFISNVFILFCLLIILLKHYCKFDNNTLPYQTLPYHTPPDQTVPNLIIIIFSPSYIHFHPSLTEYKL